MCSDIAKVATSIGHRSRRTRAARRPPLVLALSPSAYYTHQCVSSYLTATPPIARCVVARYGRAWCVSIWVQDCVRPTDGLCFVAPDRADGFVVGLGPGSCLGASRIRCKRQFGFGFGRGHRAGEHDPRRVFYRVLQSVGASETLWGHICQASVSHLVLGQGRRPARTRIFAGTTSFSNRRRLQQTFRQNRRYRLGVTRGILRVSYAHLGAPLVGPLPLNVLCFPGLQDSER